MNRFRYHSAFLPEYVSTIAISLFIMWGVGRIYVRELPPLSGNPHALPAFGLYVLLAAVLLGLTVRHRWVHCDLLVADEWMEGRRFGLQVFLIGWSQVEDLVERRGAFYGRRARVLSVVVYGRAPIVIADSIERYHRLRKRIAEASGKAIRVEGLSDDDVRRFQEAEGERHAAFQVDSGFLGALVRVGGWLFSLLPVFVVDVITTMFLMHGVFREPGYFRFKPGVYWANVIALGAAAVAARYIYYYLFSSPLARKHL